ncbi:cytochrome P450 2U1-like [Acanthaster planci]|uniref:Steroid 21-hydroxylase n=1 Tax=Acanthaster planci TaxID=133434 RepID=A0A8B7YV57_ACAPL|nr:cytochrome P450 2U1-like [Acanthaster planci]
MGILAQYLMFIFTCSPNLQASLLFVIILLAVRWLLRSPDNLPPGPVGWPVVGSALQLKGQPLHEAFTILAKQYGSIFSLYLGTSLVVVLNDAISIQEALIKQADSFSGRKVPEAVKRSFPMKGTILFGTGEDWHALRRFTVASMRNLGVGKNNMALCINEEARILCDSFEKHGGRPFNPLTLVSSAISNVICQMSFGHRYDYDNEAFVRIQDNLRKRMSFSRASLVNYFPFLFYTPVFKELRELDEERRRDVQAVVYEHLATFDPKHFRDMIDLFFSEVQQKKDGTNSKFPFVETDVERLLHDLFGAGTDTSANMIMWMIVVMMKYPDVQKKMQEELDRVVGCGRQPSWSDRPNLPYCDAVLLELLRYRPTGALAVPHKADEHSNLMGYNIPKDTMVMVNIYAAHHDPYYWEEPGQFRPERFLSANGTEVVKPTHPSYLPFGIGRRVCAGEHLARMELFLFTVSLLQRFTFTVSESNPSPSMDGIFGITLSPCPFRVCASPRHT